MALALNTKSTSNDKATDITMTSIHIYLENNWHERKNGRIKTAPETRLEGLSF